MKIKSLFASKFNRKIGNGKLNATLAAAYLNSFQFNPE